MGQHDPLNRFLLLDDLDESVCPEDPEKDVRRCILDPKWHVWFKKQVPGLENIFFFCSVGVHAPHCPCHNESIIDHLEEKEERCIFLLAYIYMDTVVSSQANTWDTMYNYFLGEPDDDPHSRPYPHPSEERFSPHDPRFRQNNLPEFYGGNLSENEARSLIQPYG